MRTSSYSRMVLAFVGSRASRDFPSRPVLFGLWGAAVACFLVGIFAPSFHLNPGMGGPVIRPLLGILLGKQFQVESFSIVEGIFHLGRDGDWLLFLVLAGFSVLFPILKLTAIYLASLNRENADWLESVESYGRWSMAEVFTVVVLVVAFKPFPGGAAIQPGWGVGFYLVSVLLTFELVALLRDRAVVMKRRRPRRRRSRRSSNGSASAHSAG